MATQPLRIGVIGCGNIASRLHLPIWLEHRELAQVVALADPSAAALEAARQKAGLTSEQVHADAAELIRRPDVDAVDVCTPQHLRRDVIIAAARAGKHILCEKPLAAVPADAADAVAAAEQNGVTFAMVHNYLWLPEVRAARSVIDSGEIGDVRSVIVNFLGVVYEPGAAGNWRQDPALAGGGVLIDMLHGVYLAEALVGEKLKRVSAFVDSSDASSRVEDTALCRFETATKSTLVNIAWGLGAGGIEISGSKGRVSIRYKDGATAPWAPLESVIVSTDTQTRTELGPETRPESYAEFPPIYDSFHYLVQDFVEAVQQGHRPTASGADGLRILEATVAAYESGATGRSVQIPLDRNDPAFTRGALGVRDLPRPPHSPLNRRALFTAVDHN